MNLFKYFVFFNLLTLYLFQPIDYDKIYPRKWSTLAPHTHVALSGQKLLKKFVPYQSWLNLTFSYMNFLKWFHYLKLNS